MCCSSFVPTAAKKGELWFLLLLLLRFAKLKPSKTWTGRGVGKVEERKGEGNRMIIRFFHLHTASQPRPQQPLLAAVFEHLPLLALTPKTTVSPTQQLLAALLLSVVVMGLLSSLFGWQSVSADAQDAPPAAAVAGEQQVCGKEFPQVSSSSIILWPQKHMHADPLFASCPVY